MARPHWHIAGLLPFFVSVSAIHFRAIAARSAFSCCLFLFHCSRSSGVYSRRSFFLSIFAGCSGVSSCCVSRCLYIPREPPRPPSAFGSVLGKASPCGGITPSPYKYGLCGVFGVILGNAKRYLSLWHGRKPKERAATRSFTLLRAIIRHAPNNSYGSLLQIRQ